MAFISDTIGDAEDSVQIQLGGDQLLYCESWNIEESILEQPARWSVRLGNSGTAVDLYKKYPPRTPFQLSIMGQPQLTGFTDRACLEMRPGAGGTELVISGRDALAELHAGYVQTQQSFQDSTYAAMVQAALVACGLDPSKLVSDNNANRQVKAGVPVSALPPSNPADLPSQTIDQQPDGVLGALSHELQAKVGERWLHFLRRHLDRAGLMLWAGGDGSFILTTPNGNQPPTYNLFRTTQQHARQSNILGHRLDNDTTNRHSECDVFAKGGGRKFGRVKSKGTFSDQEMIDYGYDRAYVVRDQECQSQQQAEYFARRKLAEERRSGWRLEYTFAGHTLPFAPGNGKQSAVVIPDTTVHVNDQFLGIEGTFYIETVSRRRQPETITSIRLMRPQDLVFGELTQTAAAATAAAAAPVDTALLQYILDNPVSPSRSASGA